MIRASVLSRTIVDTNGILKLSAERAFIGRI